MVHETHVTPITDAQVAATAPLSAWLHAIMTADPSRHSQIMSFLQQDWHKIERLQALHTCIGLPIHDYLCLESTRFNPVAAKVQTYFDRHRGASFALRALPERTQEEPMRALDLTRQACLDYLEGFQSNGQSYQIYIWDHQPSEWSGSILITAQGLYAELVQGSHLLVTQQAVEISELFTARLLFPERHIVYSTSEVHVRTILWRAISSLMLESGQPFSPFSLPRLVNGYFEFSYHSTGGYRFFDYNNHPFIARIPFSTMFR